MVHAERNAILNYRGSNKDLEGALGEMSSTLDILEVIKESVDNG